MAKPVRKTPSVSESKDFRAREYFDNSVESMLKIVGETTVDVGPIAAGGYGMFTVSVPGAKANQGQTVQVGLPSNFPVTLLPYAYVSADDIVTVILKNHTGSTIDPPNGLYGARVML